MRLCVVFWYGALVENLTTADGALHSFLKFVNNFLITKNALFIHVAFSLVNL